MEINLYPMKRNQYNDQGVNTLTTKDELEKVASELNAAHYFAASSNDPDEIQRANARIAQCENALEKSEYTIDEDGHYVKKSA